MYNWRKISDKARARVLKERKVYKRPWHAPPHFEYDGDRQFLVTAVCYEHKHIIGRSAERMTECESGLLQVCKELEVGLYAWCILPNHYHLLLRTERIGEVLKMLGKFHGASSYRWNNEDNSRGRKVWFRSVERALKAGRHFWASVNYVHHNPVKHGYTENWYDWPYSSAADYLDKIGRKEPWRFGRNIRYWTMEETGTICNSPQHP